MELKLSGNVLIAGYNAAEVVFTTDLLFFDCVLREPPIEVLKYYDTPPGFGAIHAQLASSGVSKYWDSSENHSGQ
jgi:hypothetical protein